MGKARSRLEWNQTSALLSLIANVNRGRGVEACTPDDFNPHSETAKSDGVAFRAGPEILKALYIDGKK